MESYIRRVKNHLVLPQSVVADVEAELTARAREAHCATAEACARELGDPEQVAGDYNDKYRAALKAQKNKLNLATLALLVLVAFFTWVVAEQFYALARERVQYMQAKFFYSQLNQRQNPVNSAKGDARESDAADGSYRRTLLGREPRADFVASVDIYPILMGLAVIALSAVGIRMCAGERRLLLQYAVHIEITGREKAASSES